MTSVGPALPIPIDLNDIFPSFEAFGGDESSDDESSIGEINELELDVPPPFPKLEEELSWLENSIKGMGTIEPLVKPAFSAKTGAPLKTRFLPTHSLSEPTTFLRASGAFIVRRIDACWRRIWRYDAFHTAKILNDVAIRLNGALDNVKTVVEQLDVTGEAQLTTLGRRIKVYSKDQAPAIAGLFRLKKCYPQKNPSTQQNGKGTIESPQSKEDAIADAVKTAVAALNRITEVRLVIERKCAQLYVAKKLTRFTRVDLQPTQYDIRCVEKAPPPPPPPLQNGYHERSEEALPPEEQNGTHELAPQPVENLQGSVLGSGFAQGFLHWSTLLK